MRFMTGVLGFVDAVWEHCEVLGGFVLMSDGGVM
jgi:hypothetical protein